MAIEAQPAGADRIAAIGEVKATAKRVDVTAVRRLEHIRDLLPADRVQGAPMLLLFSRSGFTADLAKLAGGRSDVELIDLPRLYAGG